MNALHRWSRLEVLVNVCLIFHKLDVLLLDGLVRGEYLLVVLNLNWDLSLVLDSAGWRLP